MSTEFNIANAQIDLEGRIVGTGSIKFPPDQEGLFSLPDHSKLVLGKTYQGFSVIEAVRSQRDSKTGFFISETIGPRIGLAKNIADYLIPILKGSSKDPFERKFRGQCGSLNSSPTDDKNNLTQGLSDMLVTGEFEEGVVKIAISAALLHCPPERLDPDFPLKFKFQHWHVNEKKAERVEINFIVDAMSLYVSIGYFDPLLHQPVPERNISHIRRGRSLKLETTMIGNEHIYGPGVTDTLGGSAKA